MLVPIKGVVLFCLLSLVTMADQHEESIESLTQFVATQENWDVGKPLNVPQSIVEAIELLGACRAQQASQVLASHMNSPSGYLMVPVPQMREWKSTDKLFKTTAKFVSLEKDEVILEPTNGKQTSIELDVLRKEDQEYVHYQLAWLEAKQPPVLRTWRSSDGEHEVKAAFVSGDATTIYLKREDGTTIEVEVALLSPEDQEYVQLRLEAQKETKP